MNEYSISTNVTRGENIEHQNDIAKEEIYL